MMGKLVCIVVIAMMCVNFVYAEGTKEKVRIYIKASESWETKGSSYGSSKGLFGSSKSFGSFSGGARPQQAELIKTFQEKGKGNIIITTKEDKADYVVIFDHEGGKGIIMKDNKIVLIDNETGDVLLSKSTITLGGAVEEVLRYLGYWE
ncbi:MAG: hypothetical protein ABIH01_03760 [Candidatus Omnitrophota bacterium]